MSIALYAVGYLVVLAGVVYLANLMYIPQAWTIGIVLLMLGAGLVSMSRMTKPGA